MAEVSVDQNRPVVIAESNFLTAQLIAATLRSRGREAVISRDGDSVLAALERHGASLLILNMNLSRPSGTELLRTLRLRHPHLKVLASIAPGQSELKATAATLGVRSFFEPPFSPDELSKLVGTLVEG